MATGVIYLDIDDEITSAASRIRAAEGGRVAVVLPYGSRVATSRINFRLLSRDAMTHAKRLSIVAGDAATRALAASAGLPVFASVAEYEASLAETGGDADPAGGLAASATVVAPGFDSVAAGDPQPRPHVGIDHGAVTRERTAPVRRAPEPEPAARRDPAPERAARPSGRRIGRTSIVGGLLVLGLATIVGAVAAYLLLPSATVAITPRQETIGPVPFRVTASTTASEPDAVAGVVPAIQVQVQAQVQDTFPATGQRVEETAATGTVRFQNFDPTTKNTIAKGAVVSTSAGVRFATDRAITIPPAELVFGERTIVVPASADVGVTAADPGVAGNVEANTITTIPRGEEPLFLKVSNPDPTTGGTRTEFPRVRQADVDEAVAALTAGVGEAFTQRLDDPALSADGSTVFPQTAVAGEPAFDQDLEALVGQEVETFDLGATVTGSVTAVDAAPVQVIAEARLGSSVDAGYELVDGSSVITIDPAVVNDGTIAFPVIVTARQVRILDPAAIEAEIRGLSLVAAREVLDRYGTAELVVWPDWVATIPTLDGRVQVTIDGPVVVEAPTDGGVAP